MKNHATSLKSPKKSTNKCFSLRGCVIFQHLFMVFPKNPWINIYPRFLRNPRKKRLWKNRPLISNTANKKNCVLRGWTVHLWDPWKWSPKNSKCFMSKNYNIFMDFSASLLHCSFKEQKLNYLNQSTFFLSFLYNKIRQHTAFLCFPYP